MQVQVLPAVVRGERIEKEEGEIRGGGCSKRRVREKKKGKNIWERGEIRMIDLRGERSKKKEGEERRR